MTTQQRKQLRRSRLSGSLGCRGGVPARLVAARRGPFDHGQVRIVTTTGVTIDQPQRSNLAGGHDAPAE